MARDVVLVAHATREAARAAAVGEDPLAAARAAGGLDVERLELDVKGAASESGERATVVVRYRSPTDVAFIGPVLPDINLRSSARARRE